MNSNDSTAMPFWLMNQLQRAFQRKDVRNLRMLNDCWFFYRVKHEASHMPDEQPASTAGLRVTLHSSSSSD